MRYEVDGVLVAVSSPKRESEGLYAIYPPEYKLNPRHLQVMAETLDEVTMLLPDDIEFRSLAMLRPYVKAKARDRLYSKLAIKDEDGMTARRIENDADRMAELICKYTAGYGILETLLSDDLVQDIYVDAPSEHTPVHVVLRTDAGSGVRQKCRTNIFIGRQDLQAFVSRLKFETGLPFSEAHPVLEADMRGLDSRITIVGPPISDKGISIAIRKHSSEMWTIPQLICNNSLSPLLSSFLWASVIGRRTVLIAGSRGAGKTTLLAAVLLEFPRSQRMLLIEDTPEIPVRRLQSLGYDIQSLRFSASPNAGSISADDALRASLRMGESAIVLGEVRGKEARVLYESMRAGNAGSAVLGTIHGNSAKGVLDRAIEDLGITERAFSSTDLVVVIGLMRSPDGSRFWRRITEVAEVRQTDRGIELVNLFETQPGCSCAKPTDAFSFECKTVQGIAGALGISPEMVMDVIKVRAHADQLHSESVRTRGRAGAYAGMDHERVRSNDFLTSSLFEGPDLETGLEAWKAWYGENYGL